MEIRSGTAVPGEGGHLIKDISAVVQLEGASEFDYAPGGVARYMQGGTQAHALAAFNQT